MDICAVAQFALGFFGLASTHCTFLPNVVAASLHKRCSRTHWSFALIAAFWLDSSQRGTFQQLICGRTEFSRRTLQKPHKTTARPIFESAKNFFDRSSAMLLETCLRLLHKRLCRVIEVRCYVTCTICCSV